MNDTLKIIAERYSCRHFTDELPTDEELRAVAEAAIQSPSAVNRQNWRVIVVKDQVLIAEMEAEGMRVLAAMEDKTMYERIMSRGGTLFYHAPSLIAVPINSAGLQDNLLDCGIVCQSIAIAAGALGLNSLICGMGRLAFSKEKCADFEKRLGFPEGYTYGMLILLGHAAVPGIPHEPDKTKISFVG